MTSVRRVPVPAFSEFLEAHRAMVHRFLVAAVGPVEADDCFQETFISALRAYPRLQHGEALDRWVLRIATRKALDAHRGRARRPAPSGHAGSLAGDRSAPGGEISAFDPGDPLWAAVRALPPRQRAAVVHRHVLDRTYDDIAAMMGGTAETARANVYQGMRRLREEVTSR